jgi:hypothetical protein
MDQNSAGFVYLKNKLPRIMDAKNKKTSNTSVNTGPKIRKLDK